MVLTFVRYYSNFVTPDFLLLRIIFFRERKESGETHASDGTLVRELDRNRDVKRNGFRQTRRAIQSSILVHMPAVCILSMCN